ncbi:hypothetical protein [uncultured Ilyobacter sp.]|uniref:hypothetical protein n=1 Tax=uncultured Ilyobacter sp. TaxID=544433 RepID=UPI0029F5C5E8|nr:hypothetical protein [uncultured Ilyobacter sp.]
MRIPGDKMVHLLAGALVALVTLLLTGSNLVGIIMAATVGTWKEWWDSKGHGKVEFADLLATVTGGVLAIEGVKLFGYIAGFLG